MGKAVSAVKHLEKQLGLLTFGRMVWSHRMSEEMTQDALAEALGVSKQYISQIERGQRLVSIEQAVRLAEVFGVSTHLFVIQVLQDQINKAGLDIKLRRA
jgi:transcriptional regulator with XRE-family HTH domain